MTMQRASGMSGKSGGMYDSRARDLVGTANNGTAVSTAQIPGIVGSSYQGAIFKPLPEI